MESRRGVATVFACRQPAGSLHQFARVAAITGLALAGIGATAANFSGVGDHPGNSVTASPDFGALNAVMSDPGVSLRGTVTLAATATETSGPGVASVTIQRSPAGANTWTNVCTDATAAYSCSLTTTTLGDGLYDFRVVATGVGGNTATSDPVTGRRIDNTLPSATMTNPGAYLSGTVTLGAASTDAGSGVASVTIQRKPASSSTWTDVCTDTSSPYECSLDTTALANGLYDFRVISTDAAGNIRTSISVDDRRVDNTAPVVSMTTPAANLRGTVTLGATSSDTGGSGVDMVTIQRAEAGTGVWVDVCTDTTSSYSCSLNTTALDDGLYDFRAVSTDNAGNTATSATAIDRRIDNTAPEATMDDPGEFLSGTLPLTAGASDAGSGMASVRIQYKSSSSGTWLDVCTDGTAPYSCSATTTAVADGLYDFRAVATDVAGNTTTSDPVTGRRVDNTLPSATMTNPGADLSGVVTLGAASTDAGSGVASVTIQRKPAASSTWTDVCTDVDSPYSCSLDTGTLSDGLYDFRAVSTDNAGNTRTSTSVDDRRIDNTAPAVTMTTPAANLRGTITLGATSSDTGGSGVDSVTIQRAVAGTGAWVDVCTDTTSGYSCSLNTTALADGLYDFRAVSTDDAGNTATSATVIDRRIDNTAPSAGMTDPGSPLSGTVTLSGDAEDLGSGLASLELQYKLSSGSTWTTHCTTATSPISCSLNTTTLADGVYDLRMMSTDNAGNTSTALHAGRVVDNDAPTVTMSDPGAMSGTANLGATASDAGSGVASVTIQRSLAGAGAWSDVCTDTGSPYSCPLDTTTLPEGSRHDFRAIATDNAGRTTTSAVVADRLVDNTAPALTLTNPGTPLRGSVTLSSTVSDGGSGVASVRYETSPAGANTWTQRCTSNTDPFSCAFNTTSVTDGVYDIRAVATDSAGNQTTSTVTDIRVDNTVPTSGMTNPGTYLRGTISLSGTGADAGSGLASLALQYKLTSDSTWIDHCTSASSPLTCPLDTTTLADGVYDFRAISTDNAGNINATTYTSRRIDNTAPAITAVTIQKSQLGTGGYIRQGGSYYVYANVNESGSGLSSVTADTSGFDTGVTAAALAAGSWTVDGVSYNRRTAQLTANGTVAAGSQAFSVTATDLATNSTNAPGSVTVDNTAPTATDVQTANVGGGIVGKPELGDTVTFTHSEPMEPNRILAGWTGASINVVVRINNTSPDELEVYNSTNGTVTRLGTVSLGRSDYVGSNRTFGLTGTASTMVQSGSTITVTLGTASGTTTTAAATGQMQWQIDGGEYDLAGNTVLGGDPLESGAADAEF